ncbi:MAG: methyltransferase domain-containing protein [Bacteroidetes bacterium]|nr:MAG: methyltransferase domain-containing protein [Bacteroidota bacterium]
MQAQHLSIREQQKASWNAFSPGWKKWDDFTMRFLQRQGDQIVEALDLRADHHVLDIATGTGEPGLTIASRVVKGSVIATDLSEGMLRVAQEKAAAQDVRNFRTQVADVCELPFGDNSFDAVSCRLGFMFFPDMELAASEMIRVLKPGGRLAVTVWGAPEQNLWITAIMGVLKKSIDMPTPPPGAPGMFRCAQPGFITTLFEKAGIAGGAESEITGEMHCSSADEYWAFMNDVVPPVVAAFKDSEATVKEKIKLDVYNVLAEQLPGTQKNIRYGARLFTAVKPVA